MRETEAIHREKQRYTGHSKRETEAYQGEMEAIHRKKLSLTMKRYGRSLRETEVNQRQREFIERNRG